MEHAFGIESSPGCWMSVVIGDDNTRSCSSSKSTLVRNYRTSLPKISIEADCVNSVLDYADLAFMLLQVYAYSGTSVTPTRV